MIRRLAEDIAGYPGLFFMCTFSGLLVPLPEDIPLLYAGIRVSGGEFGWVPTLVIAIVGVAIRDVLAYLVGRLLGDWLMQSWIARVIGVEKLKRAEGMVERHGAAAVLLGRFLIGFRAPVFLVCGASRVSLRQFVAYDTLGLLVAVPAMVVLGYAFGDPIVDTVQWILNRTRIAGGLVVVIGLAWVFWSVRGRTSRTNG